MEINIQNITEYLRKQTDIFTGDPITVEELSSADPENEGYVNYIFRVSQNGKSYILKQARPYLKCDLSIDNLPVERNYLEYLSFILRDGIVNNYMPKMFFVDTVNNIFMMEDLSEKSRIMRFQLNEGKEFVNFPYQIGTFLARNHFYTSELYLDKTVFRDMQYKFFNPHMRAIMEDVVLLKMNVEEETQSALGYASEQLWKNPKIRLAVLQVRDNFIKKGECLVHGDLHTSNLFVNNKDLYVIDMEYSFMAPFSYDLGYLLANFVSQYTAFIFNPHFTKEKRESFQKYLLNTIEQVFASYFSYFRDFFEKDGKALYRETPGYLDSLFVDILQEALGVMAVANLSRLINLAPFPDFDSMKDPKSKILAQGLSLAIDEHLLLNRNNISTPQMAIAGIKKVHQDYLDSFARNYY
jgi:5-methylthioribose kinase